MNEDKLCTASAPPVTLDSASADAAASTRSPSCVPGCTCPVPAPPPADPNAPPACYEGRPPSQLEKVIKEHVDSLAGVYNEMVISTASVVDGLPHSVSAFFYLASSSEEQRREVRQAHANFLREYGLGNGGVTGKALPLLELDLGGGGDRPLRVVSP